MILGRESAAAVVLIALTVLGNAQTLPPAADPEIVTDRPDITEASTVISRGSLQLENGMSWTSDHTRQTLDLSETLVRVGLLNRTELRVVVPNYLSGLSGVGTPSGFDDLAVGMKQQLGPLKGHVDLSVIVAVSLPTGARRVGTGGYDPFVKFPWSKELKDGWSVGGMQSFFGYTENGRRNPTYEPTFYLEKQITGPWDAFAEYGGDFPKLGRSRQVGHFGTAYRVTRTQQVDFHFGFGMTHAAPNRFFAVGYSVRIDRLWDRCRGVVE